MVLAADIVLDGQYVRLESLDESHIDGLVAAAAADPDLYRWSPVPQGNAGMTRYVRAALAMREAGSAVPFATIRNSDDVVIGSTRFWNIEHWEWPRHRPESHRTCDACEIGYTWLAREAVRTGANTEAKLLMLTHAFEQWDTVRVCLHSDARNERSRTAIARIGGRFEGILRSHRLATDLTARDSARFSIIAAEWPQTKAMLQGLLAAHTSAR